jgi:hypothetical protein
MAVLGLNAQLTVSSSFMPDIGDTLRYSSSNIPTGIDFSDTGASRTWDYSTLVPQMQVFEEYKRAASVNLAYALFGLSAIGLKVQDSLGVGTFKMKNIYDFYKKSSSVFTAEGRGLEYNGMPVPSWYSDKDEIYQFPLQFGDRDSSTFHVTFDLAGTITFTQKGYRINDVVAWGDLTTPYRTYTNCLKVQTRIYRRDSLKVNALPFPIAFNNNLVEYKWFAQGYEGPVMVANGTIAVGGMITITSVRYRDERRDLFGFTSDATEGDTNTVFSLEDTSQVSALLRQWTFTPNTVVYEGGTNNLSRAPRVRFTSPGIYDVALSVTTTAGTSAIVKEDFISVVLPDIKDPYLGTNTDAIDAALRVWPNPFSHSINVRGLSGRTVLTLMDLEGKIMEEAEGANLNLKLRPEKGAYILKVEEEGQSIRYFKLLSSE